MSKHILANALLASAAISISSLGALAMAPNGLGTGSGGTVGGGTGGGGGGAPGGIIEEAREWWSGALEMNNWFEEGREGNNDAAEEALETLADEEFNDSPNDEQEEAYREWAEEAGVGTEGIAGGISFVRSIHDNM